MDEVLEIWAEHYHGLEMPQGHVRQQPWYRVGPRGKPAPTQDDIADMAERALLEMANQSRKREVAALVYRHGYRMTAMAAARKLRMSRTRYYELLKRARTEFERIYLDVARTA